MGQAESQFLGNYTMIDKSTGESINDGCTLYRALSQKTKRSVSIFVFKKADSTLNALQVYLLKIRSTRLSDIPASSDFWIHTLALNMFTSLPSPYCR